jgi:polar amino acid transport system permease protein
MPDLILSPSNYARLMEGLVVTLQVLAGAVILGTVLSLFFGIGRLSTRAWVRRGSSVYVEFARGASAIILLFWMFYALPILFGIRGWSPMTAGILALGMNMGAYGAEIVRGCGQVCAEGPVRGGRRTQPDQHPAPPPCVLPQAIPIILPPYGNLVIEVMKGTSLVSLITLSDLAFEVQKLRVNAVVIADSATTPVLYLNVLAIYFLWRSSSPGSSSSPSGSGGQVRRCPPGRESPRPTAGAGIAG